MEDVHLVSEAIGLTKQQLLFGEISTLDEKRAVAIFKGIDDAVRDLNVDLPSDKKGELFCLLYNEFKDHIASSQEIRKLIRFATQ